MYGRNGRRVEVLAHERVFIVRQIGGPHEFLSALLGIGGTGASGFLTRREVHLRQRFHG